MLRKTLLLATTALCLSISGTAGAFLTIDEATEETQLLNNAELLMIQERQVEELAAAMQLLETSDITGPAADIMGQMQLLADQTGYIIEEQPPAELTTCEQTMSTRQFRERMKYRNDYSNGVSADFAEILSDLSNGEVAIANLSNAMTAAGAPISPISATQADVLAQAAETVAAQRESTKTLMKNKEDQIEAQLEDGDACAIQAHTACVTTGNCPEGESLTAGEEQAIASGLGAPSMSDIGITEHGVVIEENSGALLGTDGTATATLYEVQMDGSLKPVRTYGDAAGPTTCDTDVAEMNDMSLGAYFKCE